MSARDGKVRPSSKITLRAEQSLAAKEHQRVHSTSAVDGAVVNCGGW